MSQTSRFLQRSAFLNVLFAIEGGSMFLLDVVLAAALGLGARSDALYAAWSLPLVIGRGAFQSLTNSLIGLFNDEVDEELIYSQALTVIGVMSFVAALLMSLTSRWWYPLSVPGATAETQRLGIPLAAILAWLVAFLALAETQRAIYYRHGKNHIPSIARVAGVFVSMGVIWAAASRQNLTLAAIGLAAGAAAEMMLGFIGLRSMGRRFRPAWPAGDGLRRMARVVGLPLLGQGVMIGASTAERAIASFLGPGAVTAVTYAARIFQMMERFVFRGFVISTIQAYVAGAAANWRRDTRLLLLLSVPLMVIFAVLPTQIITIVFERGRFTAESTQLVAQALRFYAFAIPIVAFNRIPYALAFARNKSRDLLIYAILYAITLIGSVSLLIVAGVGLAAFGLAYIAAISVGTYWLQVRVMGDLASPGWTTGEALRLLAVALIALAGTAAIVYLLNGMAVNETFNVWLTAIIGGVCGVLLTAGAAWLLRLPEVTRISHLLRQAHR
jgi:putative peptidoglycan lipid II flippase